MMPSVGRRAAWTRRAKWSAFSVKKVAKWSPLCVARSSTDHRIAATDQAAAQCHFLLLAAGCGARQSALAHAACRVDAGAVARIRPIAADGDAEQCADQRTGDGTCSGR